MDIQQTKITKAKINGVIKTLHFDPQDVKTRENVALRSGSDYCKNRAIEELVANPTKDAKRNAVKLLLCSIALEDDE